MRAMIVILLAVDAALAIYLPIALYRRPQTAPGYSDGQTPATATREQVVFPRRSAIKHAKSGSPRQKRALDWRLLSAADLHNCVAALRAVGCPDATTIDIIVAEVNRRFAARERALRFRYEDYDLWNAPAATTRGRMERQIQLRELYAEKRALLKELLGVDVPFEIPGALADRTQSKYDAAIQQLPESKREQVQSIHENYRAKVEKLKARTLNFLEPEDFTELDRLKKERRQALGQVLTADELLDFDLKTSNLTGMIRSALAGAQPTEAELRELFKHVQRLYDEPSLLTAAQDPSAVMASLGDLQRELQNSEIVKAVLGEQRYADLQRSRDPLYQTALRVTAQAGLDADSAVRLYDLQRAAQQELQSQLANPQLSNEQRQQLFREIGEKTKRAIQQTLGEENFRRYDQIQRLAPSPGPVKTRIP